MGRLSNVNALCRVGCDGPQMIQKEVIINALVPKHEVHAYAGLQNGSADLHHTRVRHLFATVLRHFPGRCHMPAALSQSTSEEEAQKQTNSRCDDTPCYFDCLASGEHVHLHGCRAIICVLK